MFIKWNEKMMHMFHELFEDATDTQSFPFMSHTHEV